MAVAVGKEKERKTNANANAIVQIDTVHESLKSIVEGSRQRKHQSDL